MLKNKKSVHVETIDASMGLTLICQHRSKEFKENSERPYFSININDFTNLKVKSTRWTMTLKYQEVKREI